MRRYWFGDSVADVAANTGYSVSKVKMSLKRSRDELRSYLGKEASGYDEIKGKDADARLRESTIAMSKRQQSFAPDAG